MAARCGKDPIEDILVTPAQGTPKRGKHSFSLIQLLCDGAYSFSHAESRTMRAGKPGVQQLRM